MRTIIPHGRGSGAHHTNRFEQLHYVKSIWDDAIEDQEKAVTKFLTVHPKTLVNPVNSPDLPFGWSMNPYQGCEHGCAYCYARPTHEYWGYNAGLDFEKNLLVKQNAPRLFKELLQSRKWKGEPVMLSGNTDPYQPLEKKFGITRALLEIARDHKQPIGIITKNALVLRDLDILTEMAAEGLVRAAISVTTRDESLRRRMEPRTSSYAKRLQTIEQLAQAGIPVMTMMAPVIPGLNSHEIFDIAEATAEAGARRIAYTALRLNGSVASVFQDWVKHNYPDRAAKVLHQVRQLHTGQLSDSRFGKRMRGEGPVAEQFRQQFALANKKFFAGRTWPDLNLRLYRRQVAEQLDLFNFSPVNRGEFHEA